MGFDLERRRLVPTWRIAAALLFVSCVPLCLLAVGSWLVFSNLLDQKSLELQRAFVESHGKAIDLYLDERVRALRFLMDAGVINAQTNTSVLNEVLEALNASYENAFLDIGIIDSEGNHLAYVGPFDLEDKNYHDSEWFRYVSEEGVYVSDIFLGFRKIPHFVIALENPLQKGFWILRVTINSDQFDSIVHSDYMGKSGDAFIVNRERIFQTKPRFGELMARSALDALHYHRGVVSQRVEAEGEVKVQATNWVNKGRWMLVVQQDESEVRLPARQAMRRGAALISLAMLLVIAATIMATRHLRRQIEVANQRRREMETAFMRSAKLASIGELATGLAHEINNPLAIMAVEQTNLADMMDATGPEHPLRKELLDSIQCCRRQIKRCGDITQKMLQFARRSEEALSLVDITPQLQATVKLMKHQADIRGTTLELTLEDDLPDVMVDPNELEQVLVNLVSNALYAVAKRGSIDIVGSRTAQEVVIAVKDTGSGIAPENLDRVFEPFFTTKPVGKGTGLGLSVCYGIVQMWGGRIEVESSPGKGTTFQIRLPVPPGTDQTRKGENSNGQQSEASQGSHC